MKLGVLKLEVRPDARGQRLDVFLAERLETLTRSQIQTLNKTGSILVEGRQEKAGYKLRGHEDIQVHLKRLEPPPLEPQHIPIQIHYEDADLAVIDKPAGLVVHPGSGTGNQTLVHALLFHFRELSSAGLKDRPGIVHRLDKWTSGLMIVAKNDVAHVRLSRAFQDRQVDKKYLALVHGNLPDPVGKIAMNIGRHSGIRTRMTVHQSRGRTALTTYRVIEEVKGFSLLEVGLKTGRTHQIRVHLSALGYPVVGDDVYGEVKCRQFEKKHGKLGRYFLHAAELRFSHPSDGRTLHFQSPLPAELQALLLRLQYP